MDDQRTDRDDAIQKIASQIYLHLGGSDNRVFQVPCSITGCYSMGAVSAPKHQQLTDKVRETLAKRFYQHGWRFRSGPICPECSKKLT